MDAGRDDVAVSDDCDKTVLVDEHAGGDDETRPEAVVDTGGDVPVTVVDRPTSVAVDDRDVPLGDDDAAERVRDDAEASLAPNEDANERDPAAEEAAEAAELRVATLGDDATEALAFDKLEADPPLANELKPDTAAEDLEEALTTPAELPAEAADVPACVALASDADNLEETEAADLDDALATLATDAAERELAATALTDETDLTEAADTLDALARDAETEDADELWAAMAP
ncbi:MAG: hypothetical protein Q9162_004055 [Coniocarpon cinnabarinum]